MKLCSRQQAGTTSQQRSTLPVTGRGTVCLQGSKPGRTKCSPAGGHHTASLPYSGPAKTHLGELTARANSWNYPAGPDLGDGYRGGYDGAAGTWVRGYSWDGGSRRIGFPHRTHHRGISLVTADLDLIAPWAQRLLGSLQPVPGTSAWDWTVPAAAAHAVICSVTDALEYSQPDEAHLTSLAARCADSNPQVITFAALLALYPELGQARPGLAAMPDAELDEIASKLSARAAPPPPPDGLLASGDNAAWKEWYGRLGEGSGYSWPYLVGARAGLYALRAQRVLDATGYPVTDAARFIAANPGLTRHLTADTADGALARAAADLTARTAHDNHITLAGAGAAFTAERARRRAAVRADLEQAGRDAAAAEDRVRQMETAHAGLIARVTAWKDPADYDRGSLEALGQASRDVAVAKDSARQLRIARAGLIARLIAWRDPADYSDWTLDEAALARRAGISQKGLAQLRDRLAQDTET